MEWKSGRVNSATYNVNAAATRKATASHDVGLLLGQYAPLLIQIFGEHGKQELGLATAGTLMWESPISMLIFDISGASHV
jgi:hypothetical protein